MQDKKPRKTLRPRNWAARLFATAGLVAAMHGAREAHASPASFTFNAPNPGWVAIKDPVTLQPLIDPEGDGQTARDIVGDVNNPLLYIASDATHVYFRLRVDEDPRTNNNLFNFGPFGWGCVMNTDSNNQTYEWSSIVDGTNNPDIIYFYKNQTTALADLNTIADAPDLPPLQTFTFPLDPPTNPAGDPNVLHARVVLAGSNIGGTPDFFVDWAIDYPVVVSPTLSFDPTQPTQYYCGSANQGTNIGADCSGGGACQNLNTAWPIPIVCDANGCYICGDGVVSSLEGCDDGNAIGGDGCNAKCQIEITEPCTQNTQCETGFCDAGTCACDADADCAAGQVCATTPNPNQCVNPGCGNTVLEAGEGCDDGNTTAGDGCNNLCLLELGQACNASGVCASQFCDPDSNTCACDNTADCPMPNVCNVTANPNSCVPPGCGNQVLEAGEGCDDGNTVNGDGCNSVCLIELLQGCTTSPSCASGFCDPAGNLCACNDNADCPMGQTCNTTPNPNQCVAAGCGNGSIDMGEGCDDMNTAAGDGCNSQCLIELTFACTNNAQCASNFCDPTNNTCACDADVDCPGAQLCNTVANPNACVNPGCGNNVLEPATEGCDDGNTMAGDGCNSTCLKELGQMCAGSSECASGLCDNNVCACDADADCPAGTPLCKTSTDPNVCVAPGCGNGVLEANEACEDGNTANGDGCNSMCLLELGQNCPNGSTTCASGFCDPVGDVCACDEAADCPMGQLCSTLADPNQCVAPGCGNGVVEATEACDDGNTAAGDGCNMACLLELGQTCTTSGSCASQLCDVGLCACDQNADCPAGQLCNVLSTPNTCVPPGCANGVVEMGEGCDDGNTTPGDGCNATCLAELGEPCTVSAGCESSFCDPAGNICACDQDADCGMGFTCNTVPNPNLCVPAGCGNGALEMNEGCDDGNTMAGDGCNAACLLELGETCTVSGSCASGLCDGSVCACDENADCNAGDVCDTGATPNACVAAGCGNGVLEMNEGCDDGNTLPGDGCNATCAQENGEMCTDGTTCASGNCDGTTNVCVCDEDADCAMGQICDIAANPNECVTAGCGNGIVEANEGCDDGNMTAGDGCNATCLAELGRDCTVSSGCESGLCDDVTNVCVCDEDADCAMGEICDTNADPNACVPGGCGNGTVEGSEGCDDGNTTDDDGCSATCLIELGLPCMLSTACESGLCDETTAVCVCDEDADCAMGEVCNTTGATNVCEMPPAMGCTSDTDCATDPAGPICNEQSGECVECTQDSECTEAVCNTMTFTCVECTQDSQCNGGTCEAATQTCKPEGVIVEGSGCLCTVASSDSSNDKSLPAAILGFFGLALSALRRRRR